MLIVHVIVDLGAGGAELMLKRLVASHAGHPDYTHRVISLRSIGVVGPQIQALGIEVEALGVNAPWHIPSAVRRLGGRLRALEPDIVQTWMYHADLIGGLSARMAGRGNIIWGVRIADIGARLGVSRVTSWIRRACALLSSRVPARIVYVAHSARRVHEKLGYDPSKSVVIPNGYAIPPESPRNRTGLRSELGIGEDARLIGGAGRYNRQKDHRGFVKACALLAARMPDARFVLAGRGVDRDNAELAGWIAATGVGDRFHLLGERRDLDACLAGLDVFCLHSIGEGFPNVVAEAMALGVPCVVTDVGDAAALVDDTGLVVPPSDPEALCGALHALLAETPGERAARGEKARARIAAHFSMAAITARYEELYREVGDAGEARAVSAPRDARGHRDHVHGRNEMDL